MTSDDDPAPSLALIASWEWNIPDDTITWSRATDRIFGLVPAHPPIALQQYVALTHPDDRETLKGAVRHTLETGASFDIAHRIVLPDGSVRFLHCRGALVTDAVGRPVSIRGTVQNVTRLEANPPRPQGSETILLVEDQAEVRNLVRRLLEARGYHVLAAASGHDALRLTVQHAGAIDLLVTDVMMPGMSGREVALLLAPAHPRMRTLYLSGYPEESIVGDARLEPGIAFLQKPFTAEALARKVREVVESPRP